MDVLSSKRTLPVSPSTAAPAEGSDAPLRKMPVAGRYPGSMLRKYEPSNPQVLGSGQVQRRGLERRQLLGKTAPQNPAESLPRTNHIKPLARPSLQILARSAFLIFRAGLQQAVLSTVVYLYQDLWPLLAPPPSVTTIPL